MTPGARISAAIEVLQDIETRKRPAADALKDWALSHRFAGSKDRAAIASLVFDAVRNRASAAHIMGGETPRAIVLGSLRQARGMDAGALSSLCSGEAHAPPPLDEREAERLANCDLNGAPSFVAGDFPEWLEPSLAAVFGQNVVAEMSALATRAPVDLRVNTLKAQRDKVIAGLVHLRAAPTPYSPLGVRLPLTPDGRGPSLAAEPAYIKGLVEIQDEGSQLAAILALARPGEQVLDLCAGAGGKTLALAASMQNKGQIHASDRDGARLMRSAARLERAGVRNAQLHPPRGDSDVLGPLEGRCDLVFVDAPCTGTGIWRRNPDAKWRMRPGALAIRIAEQDHALAEAARFVKPRGRILYATCTLLREENEDRIAAFLGTHMDYKSLPARELVEMAQLPELERFASRLGFGLRLTPLTSGTDGFFIAMLIRGESGV
ncbi:MAG TPA: RsmB/NOP family class I SAM-dependent RNA methyltransferase [Methylocella sp.]|nr:RsmB/NOP family class I SAM-dependent RNA methyltransferase [Methylocella sp.]